MRGELRFRHDHNAPTGMLVFKCPINTFSAQAVRSAAASLLSHAIRSGLKAAVVAIIAAPVCIAPAPLAAAEAERSLNLFFTHTGERATITYKRNGRFDQAGLSTINRFLRDWRKNEPARMDPRLLDLVWELYDRSGATDYVHIVSAYRSPATNSMFRGRSRNSGVAKNSQHTLGKAMDFYIPGVKLAKLRALAMQMQVGGVGYYPTSGSPFVHLDVGSVRAWPRMSRQELARIFPDGRTMHLPSSGRPLPGYQQAVADYKRRVGPKSIEIADTANGNRARSRDNLLTAMLPAPRSSAQEALEIQTGASGSNAGAPETYVDLVSLNIPLPGPRPEEGTGAPNATASVGEVRPSAPATLGQQPSRGGFVEFSGLIASLKLPQPPDGPKHRPDAGHALVSWALSTPGSSLGMTAPRFVFRSTSLPADGVSVGEPVTTPAKAEFDKARFWSDG